MEEENPKSCFVIGVTGNLDPEGYSDEIDQSESPCIGDIREKTHAILEWIFSHRGHLDRKTGKFHPDQPAPKDTDEEYHSCWNSLSLAETPVVLLSSLAPGIDTIVAEAALDYAAKHTGPKLTVRAPLPFPLDREHQGKPVYQQCSSFNPSDAPEIWSAREERLVQLLRRIRNQPGFNENRDLFSVAIHTDFEGNPVEDLTKCDPTTGNPRRYLRYRAAGEFVATHSDLLLAFYDEEHDRPKTQTRVDDLFAAGAATIVEAKRNGLTYNLLPVTNSFSWADNGPVLHVPIDRTKKAESSQEPKKNSPCIRALALRHPYDTCPQIDDPNPKGCVEDDNPKWQQQGDELFRRIVNLQENFNSLPSSTREKNTFAEHLLTNDERVESQDVESLLEERCGGPEGHRFARSFQHLIRIRRRAADQAAKLNKERQGLLWKLVLLIFAAAVCLAMYEQWHPEHEQAHAPQSKHSEHPVLAHTSTPWFKTGLVFLTLTFLSLSGLIFYRYLRSHKERWRYDSRAIAEGIRVQFYWNLAGLGRSVSANYMQRQRGELDWIRYLIGSLCFPFEIASQQFNKLEHSIKHSLLSRVHTLWVRGQRLWYHDEAKKMTHKLHLSHTFAWGLAAAGVIQILLKMFVEASPALHHFLSGATIPLFKIDLPAVLFPSSIFLTLGFILFFKPRSLSLSPINLPGLAWMGRCLARLSERIPRSDFWYWIFNRPQVWGIGLILSSFLLSLPHYISMIHPALPGWHSWWIILTGASLLSGALCLAWSERSFLSEISRQYRTMYTLFNCADRRFEELLERYHKTPESDPEATRLLAEIQHLLFNLGCEALDENAEWLILHRARPLEPFMAG